MKVVPLNGKYVVAVSGGVDSVVLLDLLNRQHKDNNTGLIVAHFDHGIRKNSANDRQLVEGLASQYGLEFYYDEGHLGQNASEQEARTARYKFLRSVVKKENATGLITAHHEDDLIETAILNIIRGTGRKGLSSLSSNADVIRPLLDYPKSEIIDYAKRHNLNWSEDITNQDLKYLRNYIRHKVVPKLDETSRSHLIGIIKKQEKLNTQIDKELLNILNLNAINNTLPRLWLNSLDNTLSREILASWLRQNKLADFDRPTIERLSLQLKTVKPGKRVEVFKGWQVVSSRGNLALEHVER